MVRNEHKNLFILKKPKNYLYFLDIFYIIKLLFPYQTNNSARGPSSMQNEEDAGTDSASDVAVALGVGRTQITAAYLWHSNNRPVGRDHQ